MQRVIEIRRYQFEHATIEVELNRRTKKASFVEWHQGTQQYVPKSFLFAGRELKYMNGWKHILQAVQYVIDDVKKEMESWDNEEAEGLIKLMVALEEDKLNEHQGK